MADMFEYMKWRGNRKTAFALFDVYSAAKTGVAAENTLRRVNTDNIHDNIFADFFMIYFLL